MLELLRFASHQTTFCRTHADRLGVSVEPATELGLAPYGGAQ